MPGGRTMLNNGLVTKLYNCTPQDKEWITIAQEAFEIQQQRKYYATKEKQLLDNLKALADHKNAVGGGYLFVGTERKGTVNYSVIPELQTIDLEEYRKEPVVCWKLSKI